ncbi:hypothetical protein PR202_gb00595 [Eleusine coracana subsp. coracana]|uniref:Mitochondrial glycoprotein n=1 Tax=Eleusine coracana subsp. coracana TaxID=191504 RepID=A0AAV5DTR9_ELECO|nr:hypothetical protein QOZ80_5BG0427670 [Eleusine coracana subsp. coracana]GJN13847.1 hypothetical protein PR202_gb00595 [Eleusine coracana subsp. coracana]
MFLRRLRTSAVLRRASKDGDVLAAIRAELAHELSSAPSSPPSLSSEDAPGFATVSDAPQAQDVLLRRRTESEEVLVSAMLAPLQFVDQEPLRREALMKVFVTKPGATPVLHFDCRASLVGDGGGHADYAINAVRYHSSPGDDGEGKYEGPEFRELDPRLQAALHHYLVARGINSNLASSILHHLLQKERTQYVNWLKTLEERFAKDN